MCKEKEIRDKFFTTIDVGNAFYEELKTHITTLIDEMILEKLREMVEKERENEN